MLGQRSLHTWPNCLTVAWKLFTVFKRGLGGIRQSLGWVWLSQSMKSLLCFCVHFSQGLWMHQETGKWRTTHPTQTDTLATTTTATRTRVFPSPRLSSVFFPALWSTVWINLLCILSKVIPFSGSIFALSLCNMEKMPRFKGAFQEEWQYLECLSTLVSQILWKRKCQTSYFGLWKILVSPMLLSFILEPLPVTLQVPTSISIISASPVFSLLTFIPLISSLSSSFPSIALPFPLPFCSCPQLCVPLSSSSPSTLLSLQSSKSFCSLFSHLY